jgi:alpha-beta hydrolase superfamily lysophospholipase
LNKIKTEVLSTGLFLIALLGLSFLSASIFKQQNLVMAQQDIQTIKYRNLVIDLGNGVKTKAQLTFPAVGNGPFPGVLLVHAAGPADMNYTTGIHNKLFWQIAQYLSERGFVVLRYDKRGIGANSTIINNNVWGNMTSNDLIQDAEKAVNVLAQQPEVDVKRISMIGHSEGGAIVTRVAIDNPITKVKNIVLMAARIGTLHDVMYYTFVGLPLEYAKQVLDKNHSSSIPIEQAVKDPLYGRYIAFSLAHDRNYSTNATTNSNTTNIGTLFNLLLPSEESSSRSNTTNRPFAETIPHTSAAGFINIDKQFKPILERTFESAFKASIAGEIHSNKCEMPMLCPIYFKSVYSLKPTLSIIGNVSSSTGILILHGQNDSGSPVQHAFMLQQRLTELNHPDHTLITYPNLGHTFYPLSQESGPIPEYVLGDIYAWLEAHSGLSHPVATTTASPVGANTSSSNTSPTSPSSSSSKR